MSRIYLCEFAGGQVRVSFACKGSELRLFQPLAPMRRLTLQAAVPSRGFKEPAYSTDLRKDYQKIFGADHKPVDHRLASALPYTIYLIQLGGAISEVTAEPVVDTVAVDPPAAAPAPAAPEEPPVVKRFPAGSKVTIKGLTGAVELNGQEGASELADCEVVPPSPQEAELAAEVGPMVSSEHVAKTQHVMQMRHSRLESFREDVRDLLDASWCRLWRFRSGNLGGSLPAKERLDSSQNLSTLLFGFVTAILVEGFPPQKMKSEMCVDVFLFLVSWGIALLFQSMTFAVLYQRGMMTVGAGIFEVFLITESYQIKPPSRAMEGVVAPSTLGEPCIGIATPEWEGLIVDGGGAPKKASHLSAAVAVASLAAAAVRRRANPVQKQLQSLGAGMTEEKRLAMGMREEMVQATIEASTPVPQSFDQAVTWACSAALRAAEEGQNRQSMYFNTGAEDAQVTGELGGVLQFGEQVAKTLAYSNKLPEGNGVRVLFTDFGAKSLVATRWGDLPENLILDHLPPVLPKRELRMEERMKLNEILESSILLVVAPNQSEMAAVLAIFDVMKDLGKKVPVILLNARLVQDTTAVAGVMLRNFRAFEGTLLPVFHLEQFDPEDDKDPLPLNSAVIVRVWPRPYSVWEDNPEDPEAIDGYFLLDVNEQQPQDFQDCLTFLKGSRELTKRMRLKERQERDKGHRHLRELQRIGSKQAEEEITQGPHTFADSLQSRWRARNRRREERVATEWRLATVGRAVVGLVARLFALPPGPPGFKQPSCQCSDEEREEFCSLNGSDGEDLEHFPSEGVLSLDYLTLELKGRKSSKSPVKDTSQGVDRIASPREEQLHRPKELVHVTELSKMPEVKALELYENQAHDTVFGGSLFTLMSLGFCIMYHIQLRLEVYEDHPMAWFARLGIFLPPFIVAAFTIFIKPYPEKHHYRVMVEDMEDYRNPTRIRPATQCVVLFGALISCTSLAFALRLHVPPLATQPKRPVPVLRVTEWTVDRWPLFFHPKGLTASEAQDALIVTSDFAVARFQSRHLEPTAPHSYRTKDVMRLADADRFPHRLRGFTALDSNAVVKFPCGLGIAVQHGRGNLAALWPLGKPRRLPTQRETRGKLVPVQGPPELGAEYFQRPNFRVGDGVHARYGLDGDLRWIVSCQGGAL
ncbi:unnamed protein product, partial [Cladocopium goreaui]